MNNLPVRRGPDVRRPISDARRPVGTAVRPRSAVGGPAVAAPGRALVEARGADSRLLIEARKNDLVKKWLPVLAKCPEIPRQREKLTLMAQLFENQLTQYDPRRRVALFEDATTTGNIADFTRNALPLIRKTYPRLIADNLVGVQPMNQPSALIFYVRYRYAMNKGQTLAGTQIMRQNTAQQFARQNGWALDPYYTSQTVKDEDAAINGGLTVVTATLAHRPVLAGTVLVNVFSAPDTASCDNPEPILQVGFDSSGNPDAIYVSNPTDGLSVDTTTPGATEFDHATGAVSVTLGSGAFPSTAVAKVDYEYDLENNPWQPEVSLSIDSDAVTAQTRKLKTSWTLEAAQDLKATHNMDAEENLTNLMADEVVAEIDREILNDLIISAAIRASHDFSNGAGASVNYTDRNIALLYKTIEIANIIHRTTLRGPANWMVTSSDISSKFEQLNDFRASDAMVQDGYDLGITSAGSINNKLKVYKDPLFPNCKVLMGFKGGSFMDTGYIYAPYIPLVQTPTVLDPNSFTPSRGLMTRYGKKLVEDGGLYYATLTVSNL